MTSKFEIRLLSVLTLFYAVYDALNSTSAGNVSDSRGSVYIFLFALMLVMLFFIIRRRRGLIWANGISKSLILFSIYYVFDIMLIKQNTAWSAIGNFAICIWWAITVLYMSNLDTSWHSMQSIRHFFSFMFLFYGAVILYGSVNIRSIYSSVSYARVGYVYHILSMLPFLLLEQKNRWKNGAIVIATFLTIFSFKRGAILMLPIMLFVYYAAESKIGIKRNNFTKILGTTIVIAIAWLVFDRMSNGYLSSRFSADELMDGSGRSDLIRTTLDNIGKRDVIELLFGIRNASEQVMTMGPHNEWIGHTYTYGLIGIILYGVVFISIFRLSTSLIRTRSVLAPATCALFVYSLGIGMVSGWYFVHSTYYIMIFLGIVSRLKAEDNTTIIALLGGDAV